jgi:TRAP-type C4-dicarboxylate transport system permease small subunit
MDWKPMLGLPLWFWLFILPMAIAFFCWYFRDSMKEKLKPVWRFLNFTYSVSGALAAVFMVIILLLIVAQMIARWSNIHFPGSTEYAGYSMAATSFFALAHALNRGAHIRVSIFLNMNRFTMKWLDVFAMTIAAIIATYFARFAIKTNFLSEMLNDRTQGTDKIPEWIITVFEMLTTSPMKWAELWANTGSEWVFTPVWLPQIPMSLGAILLAIALWDNLIRLLVNGQSSIVGETVE